MTQSDWIKLAVPSLLMVFVTVYLVTPSRGPATLAPVSRSELSAAEQIERSVFYSRCAEAHAAGASPLYKGDPGYREGLDADRDGLGCEPLRY